MIPSPGNGWDLSLVPRPFSAPVFNHLQYGGEGLRLGGAQVTSDSLVPKPSLVPGLLPIFLHREEPGYKAT